MDTKENSSLHIRSGQAFTFHLSSFSSALYSETLKMRRSKVPLFSAIAFSFIPLAGGLFLIILKDPEAARTMGLISLKAQIAVGVADWPAYFGLLSQATAGGGLILFAIVASWVFGREFSDRTVKELLALPTPRSAVVTAKFIVIAIWSIFLTLLMFGIGLIVGTLVDVPNWSIALVRVSFSDILVTAILTIALLPYVALMASMGRGYMPPFSWIISALVLAQIAGRLGYGDWFPYTIPLLYSGIAGPRVDMLGAHSYVVIALASIVGLVATYHWWNSADQTK